MMQPGVMRPKILMTRGDVLPGSTLGNVLKSSLCDAVIREDDLVPSQESKQTSDRGFLPRCLALRRLNLRASAADMRC